MFNNISTFVGYLMSKSSFEKNSSDVIYPIGIRGGFYTFPKSMSENERNSVTGVCHSSVFVLYDTEFIKYYKIYM